MMHECSGPFAWCDTDVFVFYSLLERDTMNPLRPQFVRLLWKQTHQSLFFCCFCDRSSGRILKQSLLKNQIYSEDTERYHTIQTIALLNIKEDEWKTNRNDAQGLNLSTRQFFMCVVSGYSDKYDEWKFGLCFKNSRLLSWCSSCSEFVCFLTSVGNSFDFQQNSGH